MLTLIHIFSVAALFFGVLHAHEYLPSVQDLIVEGSNDFAFNLLRQLTQTDENVFFSSLSVSMVIAMLASGAVGRTRNEMAQVLGYPMNDRTEEDENFVFHRILPDLTTPNDMYTLNMANVALIQQGYDVFPEYNETLREIYNAIVREVDVVSDSQEVSREINEWVKSTTGGQIEKIFDYLDPMTCMVLLNAVYFKGKWETQFDPNDTRSDYFYNQGFQQREVPMMHLKKRLRYVHVYDEYRALELPYEGQSLSMIFVLPDERDAIADLEKQMTSQMVKYILQQMYEADVKVTIPKFKIEFGKELKEDLEELGMKRAFSSTAEMNRISARNELFVSDVIHKAKIEVNEEGSEASAVSGAVITAKMAVLDKPVFNADHPFLFFIIDLKSGLVLFVGRINDL